MTSRAKWLWLAMCLAANAAFGASPVAALVKQSLGFDLASVSFGMAVPTNGGYVEVEAPLAALPLVADPDLTWMTTPVSSKYQSEFSNRTLNFGFRNGRLAAVRISIKSFIAGQEQFEQRRKELIRINDDYEHLNLPRQPQQAGFVDANYRIVRGAMCSPSPESLFLMEIEITPVEPKSAP